MGKVCKRSNKDYLACLAGRFVRILCVEEAPPRFLDEDEAVAITDLVQDHPKQQDEVLSELDTEVEEQQQQRRLETVAKKAKEEMEAAPKAERAARG